MTFTNESVSDRFVRLVVAVAFGYAAWLAWPGTVGVVLAVIATVALVTGVIGWCPAYTLCGVSTKKVRVS